KLLAPRLRDSPAAARFFEEARLTGRLQHPGIPPVHEVGTLPDGTPFLAMKLIKGRTLAEFLAERTAPEANYFLPVFEHICQAVAYAHAHHVIHRDLKPANVMVGEFGEVQVMDWGLARETGASDAACGVAATPSGSGDARSPHTQPGAVVGTPAYMSPEQARG